MPPGTTVAKIVPFLIMGNDAPSGTSVLASAGRLLRERLPSGWHLDIERRPGCGLGRQPDAVFAITAPSGEVATVAVDTRNRLDANMIALTFDRVRRHRSTDALMLTAPFLSERAQVLISERGGGFADATGNLRLRLDRPALFIDLSGARTNPWPERDQPLRSLKGSGAGRVVRALCELEPPYGVRDLAKRSRAPASTTSRVLALLDREALIGRDGQSRVVSADWQNILRRWAEDYSLLKSNRTTKCIEPRGLPALLEKLRRADLRYSVTASLGAAARAPLTAPSLGVVFVEDAVVAGELLRLREVDAGVNVLLAEPGSNVVFDRTWRKEGVEYAGMAQVAVDLLTGPGRGPSEAEGVIGWMERNQDAWRA